MRFLVFLLALPALAESFPHKLLTASQVVLTASVGADAASSWHGQEANPILGQRFGAGSVGLKFGILGAGLLLQRTIHDRRAAKAAAIVNFSTAGVLSGVAIRNERNR